MEDFGPLITVIVLVIGAVVKQYEKRQKATRKDVQNRPLSRQTVLSRPRLQTMTSSTALPKLQGSTGPDSASISGPLPAVKPGQSTRSRPLTASLGKRIPPIIHQSKELFDLFGFPEASVDEEWSDREMSPEWGIEPEVPGAVNLSPENPKERVRMETEDAEAYWKSGGKIGPRTQSAAEPVQKRAAALPDRLTSEALVQGIVLAEILQPPRARRPYRPIYLDRDK